MTGLGHGADEQAVRAALEDAADARDQLARLREEQEHATLQRDDAIRRLSGLGLPYEAIAAAAGVSKARVGQILSGPARQRP